jgi:hypothetical protein
MAAIQLPNDFKDLLRSFKSAGAKYMVIGGYAVILHEYVRSTGDLDIWMASDVKNAGKVAAAVKNFGFGDAAAELFTEPSTVVRMGVRPIRIKILTAISGVGFEECFDRSLVMDFDGVPAPVIGLGDLKRNKRASGRLKDLAELES